MNSLNGWGRVLRLGALYLGQRLVAEPRVDPQRMQGQVLQALVDCDLVRTNRLRAMAEQDLRGLLLFSGRANPHQQDEVAGDQLSFKVL